MVYASQFKTETYVYACNDDSNRCYKVRADMENDETYKGISKIYFSNGGHITFDGCENEGNKYFCVADNDISSWSLDKVEGY